ncbi:amidohydrolase family protein [Neoroseomonas oryzicola]|uniref:Amidohydrolase family protein n=1 Tax=Neoroseomonas oryzicola TaxID=535904 RepID=A0A9X9WK69_9PROT|nr:amidohydrolase family protein [Neoroseomonas oryzicola]MBR0660729.1 amidohydrolase family protein [Neoroseomonas oryzicola]NKE15319.1 amidohydrolase family protein [Neoroseomonas oryzicola]
MSKTLLAPRWVWCPEGGLRENHAVLVAADGAILDVLPDDQAIDARRIDLPGSLLLPGLINLHNHAMSGPMFRGLADDIAPGDLPGHIVFSLLMPMGDLAAEIMTEEEVGDAAEMALLEGLRCGMTTVLDVYRLQQAPFIARARGLGLRSYSCPYLFSTPGLDMAPDGTPLYRPEGSADPGFDAIVRLIEAHDEGPRGRTRVGFGPHGPDSCTPDLLRRVEAKAREMDTIVSIHAAQNLHEVEIVRQRHGKAPMEHLRDLGLLREGVVVAHAMYATDDELDLVRAGGATIASCPLAFARSGRFVPLARFEASGVRLGIGTDGVTLDMVQELRTASIFAKVQSGTPHGLSATRVLRAATRDAALALGRPDLGIVAAGARADLIAVDLSSSRYQPVWDPLKAFVTNGSAVDLSLVMVEGRELLRDGRVTIADERAVTRRGAAAIERVWQEALRRGRIPRSVAERAGRAAPAHA